MVTIFTKQWHLSPYKESTGLVDAIAPKGVEVEEIFEQDLDDHTLVKVPKLPKSRPSSLAVTHSVKKF